MATPVQLRAPTRGERRVVRAKLKDLSLSARIHQRYRLIECLRTGMGALATAPPHGGLVAQPNRGALWRAHALHPAEYR